jgi:hypothetical protein
MLSSLVQLGHVRGAPVRAGQPHACMRWASARHQGWGGTSKRAYTRPGAPLCLHKGPLCYAATRKPLI